MWLFILLFIIDVLVMEAGFFFFFIWRKNRLKYFPYISIVIAHTTVPILERIKAANRDNADVPY